MRRADACVVCGSGLAERDEAWWDAGAKTVTCLDRYRSAGVAAQLEPLKLDRGVAGASAAREYERRGAKRETRVRERNPRVGGCCCG